MSHKYLFTLLAAAALVAVITACSTQAAGNQPSAATSTQAVGNQPSAATSTPPGTQVTSAAATPATASSSAANAAVKVARVQGFGLFLTDNAGRTLYAFTKDTKDSSACTGSCAQNWPPFSAPVTPQAPSNLNASLLTTFKRSDGIVQVEYDGHPLYYFVGDKNPGDIKGQGVGGVWHVLSPRGNPMLNPYAPSATSTP